MLKHGMNFVLILSLLPSLLFADSSYEPKVLGVEKSERIEDLAGRAAHLSIKEVEQAENVIEDLHHFQSSHFAEKDLVAAIRIFQHFYLREFGSTAHRYRLKWELPEQIARHDSRWLVRRAAEHTRRETIQSLRALALETESDDTYNSVVHHLRLMSASREAVDALVLLARTVKDPYRKTGAVDALISLDQDKDLFTLVQKCQEILNGESANHDIQHILRGG